MRKLHIKQSISLKLFIITSVFFILFLSMTLLFQTVYFEAFYINKKTVKLQKELDRFREVYINKGGDISRISGKVSTFADHNNADLMIFKQAKNTATIFSTIQIDGLPEKPFSMFINPVKPAFPTEDVLVMPGMVQVKPIEYDNIKRQLMSEAISRIYQESLDNPIGTSRKTYTFTYKQQDTNVNYIVVSSVVVHDDVYRDFLIAVASMQPIEEAVSVIREFYIYIFAAAILIILILSLVYSNMITKPLVELNKSARRMAELDFSVACDERSEDEIGSLALTMNFLSRKLGTALDELKGANKKLQEDIEKEKCLEQQRKEFIADVSHELKTPLSLIRGYAEGLKDNVVDSDKRETYFDVIIDEAARMSEIVSDLLDLSQMEAGVYRLAKQTFYVDELIHSSLKRFIGEMEKKQIHIETVPCGDELTVFADKKRIGQVITNLLDNAFRHTPEKGHIRIKMEEKADKVCLEVENNGEGIPEEEIEKIWDKFYRVEKSRNKKHGGTGLGLAIVRNILLLHGSAYGVRNTGQGVAFYFDLQKDKRV